MVVRSSALVEDRYGSSFAGQFESYVGLETEEDFITAVRACWAALWSARALRYMATHGGDPAHTAMGVLVQPLVSAIASGGSQPDSGRRDVAVGDVGVGLIDRKVKSRRTATSLRPNESSRMWRSAARIIASAVSTTPSLKRKSFRRPLMEKQCLSAGQVEELAALLRRTSDVMGIPVEIEWAMDERGFKLLQGRPLHMQEATVPDNIWLHHPRLTGHPAGVGWGSGRARIVNCECELERVGPGDVLVTKTAGPALAHILPRVSGVVSERGGSTSTWLRSRASAAFPWCWAFMTRPRRFPTVR